MIFNFKHILMTTFSVTTTFYLFKYIDEDCKKNNARLEAIRHSKLLNKLE